MANRSSFSFSFSTTRRQIIKLKITKNTLYSAGQWRLVDENDQDICMVQDFDHPNCGKSKVSMPVCANSKQELLSKVLEIMGNMAEVMKTMSEQIKQLKEKGNHE